MHLNQNRTRFKGDETKTGNTLFHVECVDFQGMWHFMEYELSYQRRKSYGNAPGLIFVSPRIHSLRNKRGTNFERTSLTAPFPMSLTAAAKPSSAKWDRCKPRRDGFHSQQVGQLW